jgi:hypothetical protein
MSKTSQWQSQPYLDALRPAPGYTVTGAILTSYSADLASIVAALLALVARDNDDGSGGKAELAEAIEQLRGKVRILIQRGRLARPKRIPPIAGILDQFIHEIDFDEREHSWHPKVGLVQLTNGGPAPEWRLWLGSRNLTAALNRDFGLLLTSTSDPKAKAATVPGTGDLSGRLAAYAGLDVFRPAKIRTAIDAMRWIQPDRVVVERVTLTTGNGTDKGPLPPDDVDEVIAVSPFLDGRIVKIIGAWGGPRTRRSLLSTQLALTKLSKQVSKPLAGFKDNLFVLDTPTPESVEAVMSVPADAASSEEDEDEQVPVGLHAKIFAVRKARRLRLWVGSANATNRAWSGTNVEVIAEIAASASVQEGLNELLQNARGVSAAVLETLDMPQEDTLAERLDEARKAFVASWKGKLLRDGNVFTVRCEIAPHPLDTGVKLEAGLATGTLIEWPRGTASLPLGEYASGFHTQLLQFRLSIDGINCTWLQCVEVTPPFDRDRDHHAIAYHLGMSAFLAWIAALMAGEPGLGDPGDLWDESSRSAGAQEQSGLWVGNFLTLDAMLACWARDGALFRNVARRIDTYLRPVIAQARTMPFEDRQRLEAFHAVWATVSKELLKEH